MLVYANKMDLPHAMSVSEIATALGLHDLGKQQKWFIQPSAAIIGDGLYEGLDWLARTIV